MDANTLMGLTEQKAVNILKKNKISYRIRQRDNQFFAGDNQFKLSRINLYIKEDLVGKVERG
jgi:hypothetical protein